MMIWINHHLRINEPNNSSLIQFIVCKEPIDLIHFDPIFSLELWFESNLWWFESIFTQESMNQIIVHGYRINLHNKSNFNFCTIDSNQGCNESIQTRIFIFILSQTWSYVSQLYIVTSLHSLTIEFVLQKSPLSLSPSLSLSL